MKRKHTIRNFFLATRTGKALFMALCALVTIATISYAAQNRRGPKVTSVTVEAAASGDKAITAFSFEGLDPVVTGTIDESSHTVALTVPYGTTLTNLVSTFTLSDNATVTVGGTAQVSGSTENDFTNAVTYTVMAENGDTQAYTVSVSVAQNTAKAITAFTISGQTGTTTIDENAHTVTVQMPYGTTIGSYAPTLTLSAGASVSPASGNSTSFSGGAVTYTVTAEDGSTQAYSVTVSPKTTLAIGDSYGGGVVGYILASNDPGYDSDTVHGLIVAPEDVSTSAAWSNIEDVSIASTNTAIGTGKANTDAIIAQDGHVSSAAKLCDDYSVTVNGTTYDDWFLPSKDELHKIRSTNCSACNFARSIYWTSSEADASNAWRMDFRVIDPTTYDKSRSIRVRAVRAF